MKDQKGYITGIEILVIVFFLLVLALVPITCHQSIIRKQAIMAKTGVEMSYWDILWVDPKISYNQGTITINSDKKDSLEKSKTIE